mgnify:CR=1 FL=1
MTAKEMFGIIGYKSIDTKYKKFMNDKKIIYIGNNHNGRINHIVFFNDEQILITQSIGVAELQAINKQVEELGWNK